MKRRRHALEKVIRKLVEGKTLASPGRRRRRAPQATQGHEPTSSETINADLTRQVSTPVATKAVFPVLGIDI
jgi:hypothetical protein